ncbi:MAG TPA: hypothetical protein VE646_04640, partial [Actinomycetota bacterium]|nr:hypothetical protein [Actinomycetota bacterium]
MRRAILSIIFVLAALATTALPEPVAEAAYPATNGLLAFRGDRANGQGDLFTLDPASRQEVALTNTADMQEMDPAWSPEGTRIAFTRRPKLQARPDLFVMNANGRGRVRLTATPVAERHPAWSPDGTTLVYAARTSARGPTRLFRIRADGRGRVRLTFESSGSYDDDPAWSPDGSRIAFSTNRDGGFPELYLMDPDGSHPLRLTSNHLLDADPSWSPDGTRLAFVRCSEDGTSEIYLMNADGTGQIDLTNTPDLQESDPAWSPDGAAIAYAAVPVGGGEPQIHIMNADGSGQAALTSGPGGAFSPSWQPRP